MSKRQQSSSKRTFTGFMSIGRPKRTSDASEREESNVSEVFLAVPSPPWMIYVVVIPMGRFVAVAVADSVFESIVLASSKE